MDNQHQLISMNEALGELGKELKILEKIEKTSALSHIAVEGLDVILLSLMDIAGDYNEEYMALLKNMASAEGGGLSRIRESYLGAEADHVLQSRMLWENRSRFTGVLCTLRVFAVNFFFLLILVLILTAIPLGIHDLPN